MSYYSGSPNEACARLCNHHTVKAERENISKVRFGEGICPSLQLFEIYFTVDSTTGLEATYRRWTANTGAEHVSKTAVAVRYYGPSIGFTWRVVLSGRISVLAVQCSNGLGD